MNQWQHHHYYGLLFDLKTKNWDQKFVVSVQIFTENCNKINFFTDWYQSLQIFMRLNTFLIIFSIEKGKKQGKENHKKMRVVQTTNLGTYEWRCPICLDLCHLQMQHLHTLYTNQIKSVKKTNLNKFNSNLCTSKIHVNQRCVWYAAHISVRH